MDAVEWHKLMTAPRSHGDTEGALSRLAAHFGIEPGFRDARGDDIVTSPETQQRLLAAMGVKAESEHAAAAALEAAGRNDALLPLPPVVVLHVADGRCSLDLAWSHGGGPVAWHVELEDGTARSGTAEPPVQRGASTDVSPAQLRFELGDLPWGYHRLRLPDLDASSALIVTPGKCWLPKSFGSGAGLWGVAAQLYLVRSEQNWGIGDFADLRRLVQLLGQRGCNVVGLNPLHQMILDSPEQASPYSPLTRLFLNVLYIAVPEAPGYSTSAAMRELVDSSQFRRRLAACRTVPEVDYGAVVALKLEALRILHAAFDGCTPEERRSFEAFREEKGASLRRTSILQALRQHFSAQNPSLADWHGWPEEYQDAGSDAVERFAEQNATQIDFLIWLQWVADQQLAAAAGAAEQVGMAIGLYRDLAVGCDRSGAETWANPSAFLVGAQVGAPPDIYNPAGQNWGLPPFHPNALREEAYRSFIELIRANMRHAGGLRIDHVMGLQHLYCIPEGCSPAEGAYVGYPLEDLVGILALESQRHRCLVVGEDLGTVPEGFREKMTAANILSYRVLFFEQEEGGVFVAPEDYPRLALAVAGSHDLPTLAGWWEGRDIDLKERLGLLPGPTEASSQRERRNADRAGLLQAMREGGLLGEADGEISTEQFTIAAHEFLARSGAALVVPQLDDLLGEADQVNVPATFLEHPNWRRRYRVTLDALASDGDAWRLAGRLPEIRGAGQQGSSAG